MLRSVAVGGRSGAAVSLVGAVLVLGMLMSGCAGPRAEIAYWDETRAAGIVSLPTRGRVYRPTDTEEAHAVMDRHCGSDVADVVATGYVRRVRETHPEWPGVYTPGVLGGPHRYYWLFLCRRDPALQEARVSGERGPGEFRLLLESPSAETETVGTPLLEVRGSATGRGLSGHDVVIVLDLSDSTLRHSGFDIDGDGPEGRTNPAVAREILAATDDPVVLQRVRDEDFDDSVLMAVLTAAKVLIDQLDLREHRVGLVAFSTRAKTIAPVGSDRRELLSALRRMRVGFARDFMQGTNFEAALDRADFDLGRPGERDRSVVFLSDGKPTVPAGGEAAAHAARRAAKWLAASGTRVYGFALGPDAVEALPVFAEVADATGGRVVKVDNPGDVIVALRDIDLVDVAEVRIENRTNGHPGRAVRVSPTGRFDGFVDLAPGPNTLAVTARLEDGRTRELSRIVEYDPEAASDEERARLRASLQRRTIELQLWEDMRRERRRQGRVLELSLEEERSDP